MTSSPKMFGDFNHPTELGGRNAELRFTVRRPPSGEVSPCCHRPSGGDITRSVDVGIAPASGAGFALENRLALAVPRSDVPALGASLRRTRGRDLLDPTISLVLQTRAKEPPSAAADRPVEPALLSNTHAGLPDSSPRRAGHRPHVKRFDPDRVEAARNASSAFLDPVLAPVDLAGSEFRDRQFRSRTPVGASLGPGEALLQHPQPLGLAPGQTRCVQQFARRQRRRDGDTTVDTHHASVARPADRVRDVGECDMPAAGPIAGDTVGLDALGHGSRQPKPHPAHRGHPHSTEAAVKPFDVTLFDRDLPKPFVHAGLAPLWAAVRSGEKVLHGLCEIPQRLLLHGLTPSAKPRILGASIGQLRGLLDVAGSLAAWLPMRLLFHRQIPYIPRVAAVGQQCRFLFRNWQQPEPRHTGTVTTTTDIRGCRTSNPAGVGFCCALTSSSSARTRRR